MPSFGFIRHMVSEKKIFKHFYKNRPFLPPRHPIKYTDLDKSHMKHRGLLNKHFCKKNNPNISPLRLNFFFANLHFSHYKSMGTISFHSNQSSYPTGIKNIIFVPPTYRCYIWNIERICLTASEEMSFEMLLTTDRRGTPDTCIYYKLTYEPTARVS